MDFLGLKNLTLIEDCLEKIQAIHGKKIDIENLSLDDKETFKILQKGETVGIFQLESSGMRRYLKKLKPNSIDDIIALLALYRPGPMQFIPDYIDGKQKKKKIEYLHPKLKPILESTYGICVFQEQLMQIAQQLAGFSLAEADVLRKAVGKKIRSLLEAQREKLINGMIKNGIKRETAERIWDWVLPFARYGFNKSHSTAYALIAYQTAYLKAHFPLEFMASLLTSELADVERIGFLIEECKKMGIEVLPPDLNESFLDFSIVPKKKKIRFGLAAIKNVGKNFAKAIVKEREEKGKFSSIFDFLSRIDLKFLNKKPLESMVKAGVFDSFSERNQILENLERLLEWARKERRAKFEGQKGLFDRFLKKEKIGFKLAPAKPASKSERLKWEKELLGLYVTSHPLEDFQKIIEKNGIKISEITPLMAQKRVRVGGIISSIKKILTKNGQPMMFLNLESLDGKIEVIVFPGILMKNGAEIFKENKIVFVSGKVDIKDNIPKIIAENIEEILES
jgi:DNA polymerase-3 subunit alpha